MNQIKPQKGKAFDKLPAKSMVDFYDKQWLTSTKYDGNQIFMVKEGDKISFYTSDWKEFYISVVADEILQAVPSLDFVIVAEFNQGCEGLLGDRPRSAILTTYRTNFKKGVANRGYEECLANIKVFDFLVDTGHGLGTDVPKIKRLEMARTLLHNIDYMQVVDTRLLSGKQAIEYVKQMVKLGWEGVMLDDPAETYHIGKRVNHSIKLKFRKTADLLCIGIEEGEGKYENLIGSLVLIDSQGRKVSVGSGLSDIDRDSCYDEFIGKVIEIEYEQIMDTYIQPTFICVRDDKTEKEID